MEKFCGSNFWNLTLSWVEDTNPDLTLCFEESVLLWFPCAILLVLTILQVIQLKREDFKSHQYKHRNVKDTSIKHQPIPWTTFNVASILICSVLVILNLVELFTILLNDYYFSMQWVNPLLKVVVFSYLAHTLGLYRRHAVYSSGPVFFFTLLYMVYSIINFRTILIGIFSNAQYYPEFDQVFFVCRTISTFLSIKLFLSICVDSSHNANPKMNPFATSNFLSRITFWWFNGMVMLGFKRPLLDQDMYLLDKQNSTKTIIDKFEKKLDQIRTKKVLKNLKQSSSTGYELPMTDKVQVKLNITFLVLQLFWKQFLFTALLKLISSVLTFTNPIVLDFLISFMSDDKEPMWHGFFYAFLMLISPMVESIINSQYEYWMNIVVLRVRICLISMIYKKSLRLSTNTRSKYSSGEIVNIMSIDSQRVTDFLSYANQIWSAPIQIVIAFYLLWQQVQVASVSGMVFMLILIPFNGWVSKLIRSNQIKVMKRKDKRTKLMNEILNGIKVLKLYAWENSFRDKIRELRDVECEELFKIAYLSGFMFFAFSAAPFLVGLLTFTTYVLLGNLLDPNKAFVSLSLFSIIRVPIGMLPMLLSMGAMSLVSIERVNSFLNSEELDDDAIKFMTDAENAIRIQNASFTWQRNGQPNLKDINLEVPHGKLIAIVGSVGSGKSSLLSGILGDMEKLNGTINIDGKIAFVPQQAWVQNDTLRKNVTFATPFNEKRYKQVIRTCCLEPDINMLSGGDQTEIGERGINLSGGQKQRISLARAVYSNASIYLLDDPLSAVDAHVGKKLFENVIGNNGLLANKTRILATHRATVLVDVDEIIVMKDGEISERGTLNELLDSKGAFADFITEYMDENWNENDESMNDEHSELMKSLAEKVRPIIERSKSRTDSIRSSSTSVSGHPRNLERQTSLSAVRRRKESSLGASNKEIMLTEAKKKSGKLVEKETSQTGSVKLTVYLRYFQTIGMRIGLFILMGLIFSNLFQIGSSLWLSEWSNDGLDPMTIFDKDLRDLRLIVYAVLGLGEILCSIASTLILNIACIRASKALHNDMLLCIMFAPMSFFDTTPIGRILNRFTKDVDVADNSLVFNLRMSSMQFFRTIVAFAMISLEAPIILVVLLPILVFYYIVQKIYIASSRQLKRIESTTRSPIYNHFNETVQGVSSIRAYGVQDKFISESNRRIDINNSCFYSSFTATRWLSIRLEFFGYIIVFLAALFAVLSRGTLSPGLAGLAVSYSLNITSVMAMFVRSMTDLETNIVSIERLVEYSEVPSENKYYDEQHKPKNGWPKLGSIKFNSYSTRYRPGLDLVLKDLSFEVSPNEKVGVVGRTGAGKSSLTLALFRIIEPSSGTIFIDDIDVSQLGLYNLRSKITIIPQDPVLFTGTLRLNLDPFETYSDEQIWRSLELAHLKDFVTTLDKGLYHDISEGGDNLSIGQRQLVCLARALLRKSKILVLDEATAAVDMETDDLIQETIRKEFQDCTILTIAHRLNTVIDYDKIMVLDSGKLAEFASPKELLEKHDSIFYSMAKVAKLV